MNAEEPASVVAARQLAVEARQRRAGALPALRSVGRRPRRRLGQRPAEDGA